MCLHASHDALKQRVEEQDAQLMGQAQQIKELLAKVDGGEWRRLSGMLMVGGCCKCRHSVCACSRHTASSVSMLCNPAWQLTTMIHTFEKYIHLSFISC